MLQRHQLKIDRLHPRPHHPILTQRRRIRALQLIFGTRALHQRHTAQEDKQIGRGKHALIGEDARGNGGVGVLQVDFILEEFKPGCRCGSEDG